MGKIDQALTPLGFDVEQFEEDSKNCRTYFVPGLNRDQQNRNYRDAKHAVEQMASRCDQDVEIEALRDPARIRIKIYPTGALPK